MKYKDDYPELLCNTDDENFVDMTFKIEKFVETEDKLKFHLKARYMNQVIGFGVVLDKYMTNSLDSEFNLIPDNVYCKGVEFNSIGVESDRLISLLHELYGFGVKNKKMVESETFTAIVISSDPVNLVSDGMKIKIFGNDQDENTEDDYYESFFNIDISQGYVWWNEKDSDYREALIKSLSKN